MVNSRPELTMSFSLAPCGRERKGRANHMYTGWQVSSHYSSSRQPECGTENGKSSLATADLHVYSTHSDAGCKVRSGGDGNGARLASSKLGLQTGLHTLCTSIVRERRGRQQEGRGGEWSGVELLASDIILALVTESKHSQHCHKKWHTGYFL